MSDTSLVGVVVIGRNEGDRLKRCLRSLKDDCPVIVYVDSGSTDGSVEFARSLGVDVVDLDLTRPFTMARGRNAGLRRLCDAYPQIDYVQFVDGDCEVASGWIAAAVAVLDKEQDLIAVCGRRREQYPEASRFNQLCDLEWDKPTGLTNACGGDAMYRIGPLSKIDGFTESMIAGEEGELCFRLRSSGWKILRLAHEMTRHDAAMTSWSQWFWRATRGGHAFAEGAFLHGSGMERYSIRSTRSALFWGALIPASMLVILFCGILFDRLLLALLIPPGFAYLLLMFRIYRRNRRRGIQAQLSLMSAVFCVLAKFPEAMGVLRFWFNRLAGRRSELIEYK